MWLSGDRSGGDFFHHESLHGSARSRAAFSRDRCSRDRARSTKRCATSMPDSTRRRMWWGRGPWASSGRLEPSVYARASEDRSRGAPPPAAARSRDTAPASSGAGGHSAGRTSHPPLLKGVNARRESGTGRPPVRHAQHTGRADLPRHPRRQAASAALVYRDRGPPGAWDGQADPTGNASGALQ